MDFLIIFCAKYLIIVPPAAVVVYFALAPNRVRRKLAILAGVSLPVAYGVSKLADAVYYNARPFVVEGIAPLVAHTADNGFPSNHMLLAATLAALVFVYNKPWGIFLWIVALCIGAARVLAHVHHTVDIVASVAIACAVVAGVYVILRSVTWYRE